MMYSILTLYDFMTVANLPTLTYEDFFDKYWGGMLLHI